MRTSMRTYLVIYKDEQGCEVNRRECMDVYFAHNAIIKALTNKVANKNLGFPKSAILYHCGELLGEWSTNLYKQKEE